MRRAVRLLAAILVGAACGCGGQGTDDEPIRYPHVTPPAPAPVRLPAWVPERYADRVEYRPDLPGRCPVVYGDQEITEVSRGHCRTAVEVVAAFDRRFGDTAICDQDACPPRVHVVLGWRCRLTSFFDDAYTITCRRHGRVISFGGGG